MNCVFFFEFFKKYGVLGCAYDDGKECIESWRTDTERRRSISTTIIYITAEIYYLVGRSTTGNNSFIFFVF